MSIEVTIEALGAGGDGIASHDGAKLFVHDSLPGERVRVMLSAKGDRANLKERLSEAPGRRTPPCSYFGTCGGCVAQHMAEEIYTEWKRAIIREALDHRGFNDVPIAPVVASPPGSRRRVRLAIVRARDNSSGGVGIGFRRRASHRVVAVARCAVLLPALDALIAPLGRLVMALGSGINEVSLTAAAEGCDVILHGLHAPPGLAMREALAEFAHAESIQRISVEYRWAAGRGCRRAGKRHRKAALVLETVAQRGAVQARFGEIAVALPPGAFLQPTEAGEAAIQRLVLEGLGLDTPVSEESARGSYKGAWVADCYAGLGGIGFSMVPSHRVAMFEGDAEMAEAARQAAGSAGPNVMVEARDLVRRPLTTAELNHFDAVVFNPPRAGAQALADALAESVVPRIAAVSCNPVTFARDARILADGGYRLAAVTPVDQFLWSRHVELVSIFRRSK